MLADLGRQLQGTGCIGFATKLTLLAHVMLSNMLLHTKLIGVRYVERDAINMLLTLCVAYTLHSCACRGCNLPWYMMLLNQLVQAVNSLLYDAAKSCQADKMKLQLLLTRVLTLLANKKSAMDFSVPILSGTAVPNAAVR